MKGIAPTAEEKRLHDRIAALGCIACEKEGIFNSHVSIHHAYGRTKPGAQKHVLPLCGPHHQPDGTALAFHGNKAQWEKKYGKQDDLIQEIYIRLGIPYEPMWSEKRASTRTLPKEQPRKTFEEREAEEIAARAKREAEKGSAIKSEVAKAKVPVRKIPVAKVSPPGRKIPSGPKALTSKAGEPKAKIPAAKLPKVKFPKPVKSAKQIEYEEKAKAEAKRLRAEQASRLKEANKEQEPVRAEQKRQRAEQAKRMAEAYRENQGSRSFELQEEYKRRQAELKEQAKESRKKFLADLKAKKKMQA